MEIAIIGGGIGGLTLALSLHQAGIACRVYARQRPNGRPWAVGINLLPHAMREYTELGIAVRLERVAVATREVCFYNRFGQLIFREPRGRFAGYEWPQLSIHRADLHAVLLEAVRERLGPDAVVLGKKCVALEQDAQSVSVRFEDGARARGAAAIGCDGIHSSVRKILHPGEGTPAYQGIKMWRGVTRAKPFLTGASMVIAGWLEVGKMVIYPIRDRLEGGMQLLNWVAEIQSPRTEAAATLVRMVRRALSGVGDVTETATDVIDAIKTAAKTLVRARDIAKDKRVKIDWKPPLKSIDLTAVKLTFDRSDPLLLSVELRAKQRGNAKAGADVLCSLEDFHLEVLNMLALDFKRLQFRQRMSQKPEIDVVFDGIRFIGKLGFVEALKEVFPLDGFSDPPNVKVDAKGLDVHGDLAKQQVAMPSSCGAATRPCG